MKFANVRELKINSRSVLGNLKHEDVVITNRGRPVAAVIYMDADLLESYVIAHHPTLVADIGKDVQAWKKGRLRTYTLDEVRARFSDSTSPSRRRLGR